MTKPKAMRKTREWVRLLNDEDALTLIDALWSAYTYESQCQQGNEQYAKDLPGQAAFSRQVAKENHAKADKYVRLRRTIMNGTGIQR